MRSHLDKERSYYKPALSLARIISPHKLHGLYRAASLSLVFVMLVEAVLFVLVFSQDEVVTSVASSAPAQVFFQNSPVLHGIFFILLALWMVVVMVWSFHNHFYYREYWRAEKKKKSGSIITYEVADILYDTRKKDLTHLFLTSRSGQSILARMGVYVEDIEAYLDKRVTEFAVSSLDKLLKMESIDLDRLSKYIYEHDQDFANFLFGKGVQKAIYEGATEWVSRSYAMGKEAGRWWSRDRLGRLPSLGSEWSYGRAWLLENFSKPLSHEGLFSVLSKKEGYAYDKLRDLERVLLKSREANAILVGEEGVGSMDIVSELSHEIRTNTAFPGLVDMQILVLDTNRLVAMAGDKQTFEQTFLKMLSEAERAGNVILVIENFPAFFQSVQALGSNASELILPFLTSPELKVIATSSPRAFHQIVETQSALMQRFDEIFIEGSDLEGTVKLLGSLALKEEHLHKVFFTYGAIKAIAESADQYMSTGVMPDKAIDLMRTIVPIARDKGQMVIDRSLVMSVVGESTGIPMGDIKDDERDKLARLEELFHERVIGQDEAINVLSKSLRRSRTGIRNPKRPIGSFLFLGPTGVGKTETTKTLAEVYFWSEENVIRFDMSEYSGPDALDRLIGSFDSGESGVLVNAVKEKGYGVLLLDEFEKSDRKVHDLFLQILDEGFFADSYGSRVNARNLMIIATSNAGSDLIWQEMQDGRELSGAKDYIVDEIIKRGDYRPEFINRFDAVILFHPLQKDDIAQIARLMLEKLKKRIREQGYNLVITDKLVQLLVEEGYDPQFGARPMNRIIQEKVEEAIAQKIISGTLQPGQDIELGEGDI